PVQRQRLPLNAARISSSVGSGFTVSRCFTVIMKPGVQYPHCAPPQSPYAFWIAARLPCSLMPSTVVISGPSQLKASSVQASIGVPSTSTVQAPQEESSQPRFEPVRPRSRRNTSSSSAFGSMASSWVRPLTRSSMSSFFTEIRLPVVGPGLDYSRRPQSTIILRSYIFKTLHYAQDFRFL